jgi:undecaprenyl-diphosphatase
MNEARRDGRERQRRFRRMLARATFRELVALAGGIVSIVLFALVARAATLDAIVAFNRSTLEAIHRHGTPALDSAALIITSFGSVPVIIALGFALAVLLWRAGRRLDVWVLAAVLVGGGILSTTLKLAFGMARPDVFTPLAPADGLSFPSGHSLISYCLFGFVAVWLVAANPRSIARWLGAALAIGLATAVALSRLYIGVHWPTDVVAGLLVAAFWLAACFIARAAAR